MCRAPLLCGVTEMLLRDTVRLFVDAYCGHQLISFSFAVKDPPTRRGCVNMYMTYMT